MALILSGSIDARGSSTRPEFVGSASYATTASNALTASFALNAGGGGATVDTGSLLTTASISGTTASFTKGDATTFEAYITNAVNANDIIVNVRNTSGQTLPIGTPVYATGVTGDNINVSPASGSSSSTMPAIGLLTTQLANNETGNVVLSGKLIGVDTSGFTAGQNIYVAPNGGFTNVKPSGDTNLIQNMAIVGKVNASEGEVVVIGSGRSNDVPNMPTDYIFLGDGNTKQVPLADAITGSLPSGVVSGSVQVSDITASSIINAETSSIAQANEIVFTKGDGTTFSITQDTSSYVKTVNAASPDPSGNVTVSLTSVETGTSASMLAASSSGTLNEGDVWVVSGESGSLSGSNGEAFIYSSTDGLLSISPSQQGINDQRYVFKFGDTMTGQLILNGNPTNVLGATPKQYVDPAFTGSLITSASDGTQTLSFRTRGGASETISWTSASYSVSASLSQKAINADLATTASYVTASNVGGPHGASSVVTSSYAVTASFALNAGSGGGDISKPVITGIETQSIDQGDSATFSGLSIQSGNPAMWAVLNQGIMTGSLGTTANISVTNEVTTNELNTVGTFSSSLYALTALGRSEENLLKVTVNQFDLTSSKAFGNDLSRYYIRVESDSSNPPAGIYTYWGNGAVNSAGTLDVENSTGVPGQDTTDYAIWYNATSTGDKLIAVEFDTLGSLDSLVSFNVADYTNTTTNQTATGLTTVTSNEKLGGKLFGKYVNTGYYQISAPHSDFFLEISGSGGLFNSFGTKTNGDWMFGFNLLDDWTIGNTGLQMLSPSGSANGAFVFAPNAYFITTSETDFYTYGDHDTQVDSTSGISWTSTNGVMAASGSSIIVYFDDSTDTTYLYVDGTQEINSTSVDSYMISSTTTDPILNFGNPANRGENNYANERNVINFPYRINNLWVANTGTSLGSGDISELASHADISDSTNYASIDFHSQNITSTPEKGAATLSRKSFTRPS
jgi:hypothetical protein